MSKDAEYEAIIKFKTEPTPNNLSHCKHLLEKHLNDSWVEVNIIKKHERKEG